MDPLRAVWRAFWLIAVCSMVYVYLRVSDPLARLLGRIRGDALLAGRRRGRIFRRWAWTVGALTGMKATVHGGPPKAPFFLVANHLGYVDVLLLAGQLEAVFVAKAEIAGWPAIGAICRSVDTLFIDRGSKRDIPRVMEEIRRVLEMDRGIIIFPEGTSSGGDAVQRFKPSLLESAAQAGIPVSYASLSYRTPEGCAPARQSVCWWGDMAFGSHLFRMLSLPRFEASLTFGEEPILEKDRKVLATRLQDAVQRQFQPVV